MQKVNKEATVRFDNLETYVWKRKLISDSKMSRCISSFALPFWGSRLTYSYKRHAKYQMLSVKRKIVRQKGMLLLCHQISGFSR